ncbi:MAG: hypothetical protein R3F35_04105 [Myxococcota bacterium]
MGEIYLRGRIVAPVAGSKRTLLNANGTPADAMLFQVALPPDFEDLPLLPIAAEPPRVGEEVILIGFGRIREKVVTVATDGPNAFGFSWSEKGEKRWGTNRIATIGETLHQSSWTTRSFATVFDPPDAPATTPFEAQATVGDSGGGVFVRRDGRWMLVGLMTSVTGYTRLPERTSIYGDTTYVADLTRYREDILRFARPACANERDDDGDELIDFEADPGCDSPLDPSERDDPLDPATWPWLAFAGSIALAGFFNAWRRRRRPSAPLGTDASSPPARSEGNGRI